MRNPVYKITLLVLQVTIAGSFNLAQAVSLDTFEIRIQRQYSVSKKLMLQNISRKDTKPGVVVASTSMQDPNYYFHWIRDAALTIDTVVQLYATGDGDRKNLRKMILDYVDLSRFNQITPNLSGGLGEPKFNVDGSADNTPWGRPQSDGPALRAIALIHFAHALLNEGEADFVRTKLFDVKNPTESVVRADLEYISQSWRQSCFDVWEETRGNHFYTMMVQRRALIEGADLARTLGDLGSAANYQREANNLTEALGHYWYTEGDFILESLNQVATHPKSGLDVAVILAVLHGYADDDFFSPAHDQILSTAMKLKEAFDEIYKINQDSKLTTAIGRYPEDRYNGDGDSQGNPWFLTTVGYAELCYRARIEFRHAKSIKITALNKPFLDFIAPGNILKIGQRFNMGSEIFEKINGALKTQGDRFLERALRHAAKNGAMSEEINRDTGVMQGAQNLTWSYVSFIRAYRWRTELQ